MELGAFDSWRPAPDDVIVERNWQRFCPFSPQSPPLHLPAADEAGTTTLPLFGAASTSAAAGDVDGAAAADTGSSRGSGGLSTAQAMDVMFNAGGPVWAMDWCPAGAQQPGGAAPSYLAVACHPLEAQRNVVGTRVQGPNCIQVWEVDPPEAAGRQAQQAQQQVQQAQRQAQRHGQEQPMDVDGQRQQQQPQQPQQPQLPRMALGLAHEGGLGLLAAALGDGSVRVWAVPRPQAAAAASTTRQQQQSGPLVVSLQPVAAVHAATLGGSLPSVVDWLPAPPYDLLAVGSWDGSVAVFRLAPEQQREAGSGGGGAPGAAAAVTGTGGDGSSGGAGDGSAGPMRGLHLLSHFSADVLPLRALRWVPPAACAGSVDSLHRHLIITGGHEGTLRVWDLRDTFQPIYSHVLSSTSVILAAEWTERPLGIVVAMEDASLRGVVLDSDVIDRATKEESKAMFSITWRGFNMGAIWGLAVQQAMQVAAYAGEDGEVGVFPVEFEANSKRRRPHSAIAGLRMEGEALSVRTPAQLARDSGVFAGKVIERNAVIGKSRLPEESEALHRVAWSAHTDGSAWLASGGAAGLVRCQWISQT